ncbi:murein hydrolase activator NlpD precursor [Oxobacter pfennigii]|uniref:Murein hydrolase activator NlpD n=1 Tax=Oxobacter pfennigii TaxID=36849 RepID=A0A0P9AB13_9CLOT|nr:peptidoglycan DD-metalloendopeptidase family protein [Oxobacter pfennigii]KPU42236.1 murein hydrolase activator NlpD precursor [Oxobacter pfennigii]
MDKRKKYAILIACLAVTIISVVVILLSQNTQDVTSQQKMEVTQTVDDTQVLAAADSSQVNEEQTNETALESTEETDEAAENSEEPKKPEILTYTVKSGDTLGAISNEYGVTANSIASSSNISVNSTLKIGQQLRFPSIKGILYKIKSGDTLSSISKLYDIKFDDIVKTNGMESANKLNIGQEIILPGVDQVKTVVVASKTAAVASRGSSVSAAASAVASISMWPVRGTLTSLFGPRWGTTHKGIDIAAPTGTNVSAFLDGKVVHSGWEGGYGYLVIIDHGNGLRSYYGHNSKLLVSVGQQVSKGDIIAKVGSTGDSTGPHCHFEIRKNGTAVNPLNYLK